MVSNVNPSPIEMTLARNEGTITIEFRPAEGMDITPYVGQTATLIWETGEENVQGQEVITDEAVVISPQGAVCQLAETDVAQAVAAGYSQLSVVIGGLGIAEGLGDIVTQDEAERSTLRPETAQSDAAAALKAVEAKAATPSPAPQPPAPMPDAALASDVPPTGTLTGTIVRKEYDYGFIQAGGQDYFLSASSIDPWLVGKLPIGIEVYFEVNPIKSGPNWEAINVHLVSATPAGAGSTQIAPPVGASTPSAPQAAPPAPSGTGAGQPPPAAPQAAATAAPTTPLPAELTMLDPEVVELGEHNGKITLGIKLTFKRQGNPAPNVEVTLEVNDKKVTKPSRRPLTTASGTASFLANIDQKKPYCTLLAQVEGKQIAGFWGKSSPQPPTANPLPTASATATTTPVSDPARSGQKLDGLTVKEEFGLPFSESGQCFLPVWLTLSHTLTSKKQGQQGTGQAKTKPEEMKKTVPTTGVFVTLTSDRGQVARPHPTPSPTSEGRVVFHVPIDAQQTSCNLLASCEGKQFPLMWKLENKIRFTVTPTRITHGRQFHLVLEQGSEDKPCPATKIITAHCIGGSEFRLKRLDTYEDFTGTRVSFECPGDVSVQVMLTKLTGNEIGDKIVFSVQATNVSWKAEYVSGLNLLDLSGSAGNAPQPSNERTK